MPKFNIVVFAGDYAGPEVTAEGVKVSPPRNAYCNQYTQSSHGQGDGQIPSSEKQSCCRARRGTTAVSMIKQQEDMK